MRIIIGVHHFPPAYLGGAEWRAYRTASALLRNGHDASVVCVESVDNKHAAPIAYHDEVFQGVPVRRLSFDLASSPDPLLWEYDNQWIGDHLRGYFAAEKPDVFHVIGGYLMTASALTAANTLRIPTVVTLTDFWFLCRRLSMLQVDGTLCEPPFSSTKCARCLGEEKRRFRWLGSIAPVLMNPYWRRQGTFATYFAQRREYLQQVMATVDLTICPSRFLQKMYKDEDMLPERTVFLRQGLTFAKYKPEELPKEPSSILRVGYMGQIARLKGVQVLIEAVHALDGLPLELHIYGDTTAFPSYVAGMQEYSASDVRIEFKGTFARNQLTDVLRTLDVVVVPSLWYENSPNVILEAFAHNTPVIASNFGGMAELVEDGVNGLLFQMGDLADLQRVLRRLVEEPGLLDTLRDGATLTTIPAAEEELTALIELYAELVASTPESYAAHSLATASPALEQSG